MVILTICNNYTYVAINLSIIVFLFCIDSLVDSTYHIMVSLLYYVSYKGIIYVDEIRCLQQNMHTITVDFPQMKI